MEEARIGEELPCPRCPSSDAFKWQDDKWGHCFSCGANVPRTADIGTRQPNRKGSRLNLITDYETKPLKARGITEETCKKFAYGVGHYGDQTVQVAPFYQNGKLVAQKIRFKNKDFKVLGDGKRLSSCLFGSNLWTPHPNKKIVVTEGELDALSVAQAQGNKWPVVSVPNGAQGASKSIEANIEYLEGFKSVVFMFDQDDPGQAAAKECAELIQPGKACIASLPDGTDPNEVLLESGPKALIDAMWNAKVIRPDGIVLGEDPSLWEMMLEPDPVTDFELPWKTLSSQTKGIRKGEITLFCAGSGTGKSTTVREIAKGLIDDGQTVGYIALEESVKRSVLGLMSLEVGRPLHLEAYDPECEWFKNSFDKLTRGGHLRLYDHWGSLDQDNLMSKIRALKRGFRCEWIVLDHISIVVSGFATDGDERKMLDVAMTKIRSLAEELNIGILLVAHLKRTAQGAVPFDRGGQISMTDLRGSAALEQLSDTIIGAERDQQDPKLKHYVRWRVLKCRFHGDGVGLAGVAKYNVKTGRLVDYKGPDPYKKREAESEPDF